MTAQPPAKSGGSNAVGSRLWRPSVADPPSELNIFAGINISGSSSVTRSHQANELRSKQAPPEQAPSWTRHRDEPPRGDGGPVSERSRSAHATPTEAKAASDD
eukprot:2218678-Pyramimonas_sp.AAC.1